MGHIEPLTHRIMKRRHLTTIVVATSLMLPLSAFANAGDNKKEQNHENPAHSRTERKADRGEIKGAAHADFQRIDREALESQMTAQELIGKTVVGSDGERLGAIHDIGFAHFLPSELQADA